MDQVPQMKSKSTLLYAVVGVLCLVIFAGIVYWQYQKPERKSDATDQSEDIFNDEQNTNPPTEDQTISLSDNFYRQGAEQLTAKNYAEAIKFFDQAIAADAYEPAYYSDKSEAQYNSGDKQGAIDTLKQGSSLNPDSDLLKSKLDVLTKDQFSDPNADTPRE